MTPSRPATRAVAALAAILFTLLFPALLRADEVKLYVSPAGDDAADGTLEKPLRTVGRARDVARERKKPDTPVTVFLRGGMYGLSDPLVLASADGGTERAPVTYAAYGEEKPVISGGVVISGWAKTQLNGREVWAAPLKLPDKAGPLRSLWVNGRRAVRARYPNRGYLSVGAVPEATGDWMKGVASFQAEGKDAKALATVGAGAETVVMSRWVESRLPVVRVDPATAMLHFGKTSVFVVEKGDRYWVEGTSALLDEPGEWSYDGSSSTIYYLPRSGEDMKTVTAVVPVLSQVLRLDGRPAEGKTIDHVIFRGITFSHTDWGQGWPGADDKRSGFSQAAVGVPAAVAAEGARHCVFDNCAVEHVGTYGLALGRGCQDDRVTRCTLRDLGAGGIKIGETSVRDSAQDQACRNEVSDCRLLDGGNLFPSAVGLWVGQSYDNRITHNEIADFYYTAISVGWTWGYGKSLAHGNVIENNHVHHIGRPSDDPDAPILSDMGGIYTLGIQPGTVIRNNSFHDIAAIKYGGWGIYFDEGTSGVAAENNLVYNTTHGGFHQHYGKENLFRNNIIAFGTAAQIQRTRLEPHQSFTFERNIVYWDKGDVLAGTWDGCNAAFDHNVYWRADGATDFRMATLTFEQWRAKGMDQHSLVADPCFVNPAGREFRLGEGSPAPSVGFVPFDLQDVGPRQKPGR